MNEELRIFTDGGARGNPGPAAIGVYIENSKGQQLGSVGKTIGVATNNTAEYKAVIEALGWIIENKKSIPQNSKILFFLDSLLVCSQIRGVFKVKDENLKMLLVLVRQKETEVNLPISYSHIPREKNKKADSLVNYALDNIG